MAAACNTLRDSGLGTRDRESFAPERLLREVRPWMAVLVPPYRPPNTPAERLRYSDHGRSHR